MKGFTGILPKVAQDGLISIETIQRWIRQANESRANRPMDDAYEAVLMHLPEIDAAAWIHSATIHTGVPYHPIGNPEKWLNPKEHCVQSLYHYQKCHGVRLYDLEGTMVVGMLDPTEEGRQEFTTYFEKWRRYRFFTISPDEYARLIATLVNFSLPDRKDHDPEPDNPAEESEFEAILNKVWLHPTMVSKRELAHIDETDVERENIVPLRRTGPSLWLATTRKGWNESKRRRLRGVLGLEPKPLFARDEDLDACRAAVLRSMAEVRKQGVPITDKTRIEIGPESIVTGEINSVPPDQIWKQLLATAIEEGSSDIHIQRGTELIEVRMRIDGCPETFPPLDIRRGVKLIEYIKDQTGLQPSGDTGSGTADAGYSLAWVGAPKRKVNLRLASITQRRDGNVSEKITIRILDPKNVRTSLDDTNIDKPEVKALRQALAKDKGLIFVTGPTGSGKSTTLYAALCELSHKDIKRQGRDNVVYSIEQPIEYTLPSVFQIEADDAAGLSYAQCLRSLMRQDPDVIMVGEVRDPDTAALAVNAADTGHLVLSTLHTTDTLGVMNRMVHALKVNPEQLLENLILATAQRLYPKRCPHCRKQDSQKRWYNVGCAHCHNRGRKGRTLVMETLPLQSLPEVKEALLQRAPRSVIEDKLKLTGWQNYIEKAKVLFEEGVIDITVDEIS